MDKPRQFPAFLFPNCQSAEKCWRPSVDIYRTRNGWVLKFDLAGVRLEDVAVSVEGCRVAVRGTRRDWLAEEIGSTYYSMEIAYSGFERVIELPCTLANPAVSMEARDGLLIVRISG